MQHTFHLPGPPALSPFRLQKLLDEIRGEIPQVSGLFARFVHFVHLAGPERPLTDPERERLAAILDYGEEDGARPPGPEESTGQLFLVTPRPGTVSPWSSKASDVVHHCAFAIARIERGIAFFVATGDGLPLAGAAKEAVAARLHDPMTQTVSNDFYGIDALFAHAGPAPLARIPLPGADPEARVLALEVANRELGLALNPGEIRYLADGFAAIGRDPTDVELMMFAQVNSEHCRHKIFNADWIIDGIAQEDSLFGMIRRTHAEARDNSHILGAYADNAAVMRGLPPDGGEASSGKARPFFYPDPGSGSGPGSRRYGYRSGDVHILIKVETHNHPTAISPYPGAATGSGGEIRDEAATGRGARAKAGLTGFSVSNLRLPGFVQPWEKDFGKPARIASALEIMRDAPIGAAGFNNEFGRPALLGYFRTFEVSGQDRLRSPDSPDAGPLAPPTVHGYHKPIMIAGGLGNIREEQITKKALPTGAPVAVLGGPAMLIGLGGGAASSQVSGSGKENLDFASVQRENPEMQRRCQEVIDRCWQMGEQNPILSLHDVGAGGLSNALPELVHGGGRGGHFNLRAIPSDDPGMSPLALWCNESQERYVLAIAPDQLGIFLELCRIERCPCAVLGGTTDEHRLTLNDDLPFHGPAKGDLAPPLHGRQQTKEEPIKDPGLPDPTDIPIDIPMDFLFGSPPRMVRDARRVPNPADRVHGQDAGPCPSKFLVASGFTLSEALQRVLRLPAVAGKNFLITIGDRSVTGLVARDQMAGPWQVPVADCAVTATGFRGYTGEAMAMGERAPVALLDGPASGRLAVAEAITNIAGAAIPALDRVVLSANWMAACGHPGEDARLFDTVRAVSDLCLALGIVIPVGKDSLSMKTLWQQENHSGEGTSRETREVTAPLSLIVSAFAPVSDIRKTLTPQLLTDEAVGEKTELLLIDLGRGKNRLGGSALAQVFELTGVGEPPDLDRPGDLPAFFQAVGELNLAGYLLAYHDRSDGGLLATICEMAFAGHTGATIEWGDAASRPEGGARSEEEAFRILFSEEPGAVIQIRCRDRAAVLEKLQDYGELKEHVHLIGRPETDGNIRFRFAGGKTHYSASRVALQRIWSETGYRMQALRDNPACAKEEFDAISDTGDPGLSASFAFPLSGDGGIPSPGEGISLPGRARPRIAILREQGVNGHVEMAAAFHRAGFDCFDVHMSEIIQGGADLAGFQGLAACGGFSYGDVLGAGGGWANSILHNPRARDVFQEFLNRPETFTLGVCNGCQMLSQLTGLIPGTGHWPRFRRNRSEQFEARLVMCEILPSPSILLTDMAGARLPVVVAHGEGRASFPGPEHLSPPLPAREGACLRYIDNRGAPAARYPANPNGSPGGLTGFTTRDGRVTIMMPHPERMFRACQYSWCPDGLLGSAGKKNAWGEDGPWMRMFRNARAWVG